MANTKRFIIRDREAGNVIEACDTLEEAKDSVKQYEYIDLLEGTYTPDFYEIYDTETEQIID